MRRPDLRGEMMFLAVVLGCAAPPRDRKLCDLNELAAPVAVYGWNKERTDLMEKPIAPILIECECEIHPILASIETRGASADARSAVLSGDPHLIATPDLGGVIPVPPEVELSELPPIPSRQIPGTDEEVLCFERERLEMLAQDYAEVFNTTVIKLLGSR